MIFRIVYDARDIRTREDPYHVEERIVEPFGQILWKRRLNYATLGEARAEIAFLKANPIKILEVIE